MMKIASFNDENLYERPKAFQARYEVGEIYLGRYHEVNSQLPKGYLYFERSEFHA